MTETTTRGETGFNGIEALEVEPIEAQVRQAEAHLVAADRRVAAGDKIRHEGYKRASAEVNKAKDHRIAAGIIFIQVKRRVMMDRELGDITWEDFCRDHCTRSRADINKCIRLADAPDPQKARAREREQNREDKRRERARSDISRVRAAESGGKPEEIVSSENSSPGLRPYPEGLEPSPLVAREGTAAEVGRLVALIGDMRPADVYDAWVRLGRLLPDNLFGHGVKQELGKRGLRVDITV